MKRQTSVILATGVVLALVFLLDRTLSIPPAVITRSAITETFVRIHLYAETHKALPSSLDDLPKREGYANRTSDGWKRPLQYTVTKDGLITLQSLGADGKLGGEGDNTDMAISYRSKRPDGSLWAGLPMWILEAEVFLKRESLSSEPGR
jgi:hypothetical protein